MLVRLLASESAYSLEPFKGTGTVLADGAVTFVALWQLKAIIIKQCTSYMLYLVAV